MGVDTGHGLHNFFAQFGSTARGRHTAPTACRLRIRTLAKTTWTLGPRIILVRQTARRHRTSEPGVSSAIARDYRWRLRPCWRFRYQHRSRGQRHQDALAYWPACPPKSWPAKVPWNRLPKSRSGGFGLSWGHSRSWTNGQRYAAIAYNVI